VKDSKFYDLIVCIRCHAHAGQIIDTIDAARMFTNATSTKIMVAIDGSNMELARRLEASVPKAVYISGEHWGWGAGLYGLLSEAIVWAREQWNFAHFMSIDYDTLFIKPDVDMAALNLITEPETGLVGHYSGRNVHWEAMFLRDKDKIKNAFGQIPKGYVQGEGVQGGCFILTLNAIERMLAMGKFHNVFRYAKIVTDVADDHLVPFFVRQCGLKITQISDEFYIRWSMDRDYRDFVKMPVKVFHPTKLKFNQQNTKTEWNVRNFFRQLRGRDKVKVKA